MAAAEPTAPTAIARIAAWSERLGYEQVPDAVRGIASRCLIDTVGVAIAGSCHSVLNGVRSFARAQYAAGEATVLGVPWRLQPAGAALVNATAAHALDFDDNCYAGSVHGSAVIVPAGTGRGGSGQPAGKRVARGAGCGGRSGICGGRCAHRSALPERLVDHRLAWAGRRRGGRLARDASGRARDGPGARPCSRGHGRGESLLWDRR